MAGSVSYINQPVSLISKALIRYEGILFSINPEEATITLSNGKFSGVQFRLLRDFSLYWNSPQGTSSKPDR